MPKRNNRRSEENLLSLRKLNALQDHVGREILFAFDQGNWIEFVDRDHRHFTYNKNRESYREVFGEDVEHLSTCRRYFEFEEA